MRIWINFNFFHLLLIKILSMFNNFLQLLSNSYIEFCRFEIGTLGVWHHFVEQLLLTTMTTTAKENNLLVNKRIKIFYHSIRNLYSISITSGLSQRKTRILNFSLHLILKKKSEFSGKLKDRSLVFCLWP